MLIDNVDISSFNAKQLTVDIQTSVLTNSSEWIKESLLPAFQDNYVGFKTIKVELKFTGSNRDEVLTNISNLMSKLLSAVVLKLDGYSKNYKCILNGSETTKTVSGRVYRKTLTFTGYAFGDEITETMSGATSKTIDVPGNIKTPAIVEITPVIDIAVLTLNGLSSESITINNLKTGEKVIINGEDGTTVANGVNKFPDVDLWEFPRLQIGTNTITADKNSINITIKYKPRFI